MIVSTNINVVFHLHYNEVVQLEVLGSELSSNSFNEIDLKYLERSYCKIMLGFHLQ